MKIASILTGVAALTMVAGAAHAQSQNSITVNPTTGQPTPSSPVSSTFALTANVPVDCSYSFTGADTVNFGTLGIYANEDAGLANAFRMTSAATASINAGMAGCNTRNKVQIQTKSLVSDNESPYDKAQFQNNLPYLTTIKYTTNDGTTPWQIPAGSGGGERSHGAWKSAMTIDLHIYQQSKALLSGNYTGEIKVIISAL